MNIRKLFFSFFILIVSFFIFDNVSALTDEMTTNSALDYYSDVFKERFENELSSSNLDLEKIDNKLKEDYELLKNTYPYYMTIVNCNNSNGCYMYVYYFKVKPDIVFKFYKNTDNLFYYGYINNSNDDVDVAYKSFSFGSGSSMNDFNNFTSLVFTTGTYSNNYWLSRHFVDSSYDVVKYTDKHYTLLYPAQILYDSNFDIKKGNTNNSSLLNPDLKIGNYYYQKDDTIPTYKEYLNQTSKTPNVAVNFENLETYTKNDVEYVSKKRVNMLFNNYDITKHQVYIAYDVPYGFWEIMPSLLSKTYSLDFDYNTKIYLKILDRETQEELYNTIIDVDGINPSDLSVLVNSTPFNIFNDVKNNKQYVIDKKVDIIFSSFIRQKYTYYYTTSLIDEWVEIYSVSDNTYSFHVKDNCDLTIKVIDNDTQQVIYNETVLIDGISYPIPIATLILTKNGHYQDNDSRPIMFKKFELYFDFFNTTMYDYYYYDVNYNFYNKINITKNNQEIWAWDNITIPVYVRNKITDKIIAIYKFPVSGIIPSDKPIAFFDSVDVRRSCGDSDVLYAKEINISFSFVNTNEYSYQYKIVSQNEIETTDWVNEDNLRYNNDFFIKLTDNATIYVRIIDKLTGEYVFDSSYEINDIEQYDDVKCILGDNYNDNLKALQKYLIELKETSNAFNELFYAFYNNLPSFVRLGLIFAYIVLLVFITLILGGWK